MPAVILLHPLGDASGRHMIEFAHYLAQRGIGGLRPSKLPHPEGTRVAPKIKEHQCPNVRKSSMTNEVSICSLP